MKTKLTVLSTLALIFFASCSGNDNNSKDTIAKADSLARQAICERDSLIILFNEISEDVIRLRQLESIVVLPENIGKEQYSVPTIQDDIKAIQQSLKERRERLAILENKLSSQIGQNKQLQQMIENLKAQISQNENLISELTQQLSIANNAISNLNNTVDSLNNSVANVTAEKNSALQRNEALTDDLNRCFYALGSGKELKQHKIIETGFLKKTKVLQGDYETSYFTTADKRNLTSIPLYSKKAKVHTTHPADSYTISEDSNKNKTLNITNPSRFWSTSNYLVIQTD
jgi:uncharacterized protein YoxC